MPCIETQHRGRRGPRALSHVLLLVPLVVGVSRCFCGNFARPTSSQRFPAKAWRGRADRPRAILAASDDDDGYVPPPSYFPLETLVVGQKCEGVVMSVVSNGAYVDIGSTVEAYLPFYSMQKRREAKSPDELVKEGDSITVYIQSVDGTNVRVHKFLDRISIFQQRDTGSAELMQEKVGETMTGIINSVHDFGIFVALEAPSGERVLGLMPRGITRDRPLNFGTMLGKEVETVVDSVTAPEEEGKNWRMAVRVPEIEGSPQPQRERPARQQQAVANADMVSAEVMKDKVGETVTGVINSIQKFGVFVALKTPDGEKYAQGLMPGRFIEGQPEDHAGMVGKEVEALVESVTEPAAEGQIWRMSVRVPSIARKSSPKQGGRGPTRPVAREKLVSAEVMQEKVGETVPGIVNSIQDFGVFIALKAPTGDKYIEGLMPGRFIEGEPENYASMVGKEVEAVVESVTEPEEAGKIWRMSVRVPDMLKKTPAPEEA